jgi:hypothetical protein
MRFGRKEDRLMATYNQPEREDFDRNLSFVVHSAQKKARKTKMRLTFDFNSRGTLLSSMYISAVVECIDTVHEEALAEAMNRLYEFGEPLQVSASELVIWARPHLNKLMNILLGTIEEGAPQLLKPEYQLSQRVTQYHAVFVQRTEAALRDYEVGFIAGKNVRPNSSSTPKEVFFLKPSFQGIGMDLKEVWRWIIQLRSRR